MRFGLRSPSPLTSGQGRSGCLQPGCRPWDRLMRLQEILQRAIAAPGLLPLAVLLPDLDQQCMILVKQVGVSGKMVVQEFLDFAIIRAGMHHLVPGQDSPRVIVGDKKRVLPGVQEYGIHCLRPQAFNLEKLATKFVGGQGKHVRQGAPARVIQPGQEVSNRARLLPEETGRPDALLKFNPRSLAQAGHIQKALFAQLFQCQGSILPCRILDQDGP